MKGGDLKALLYRPKDRWQIGIAFLGAILIHLAAVAVARSPQERPNETSYSDSFAPIDGDGGGVPEPDEPSFVLSPPPTLPDSDFVEELPTLPSTTMRSRPRRPVIATGLTAAPASTMARAKALAIVAPRPDYPYEARREHATGSGVIVLTVDRGSGLVMDVRLDQSTGHPILDRAALSAFRRWRFQPGTVDAVRTPITFQLTGATF
ncbi:MAG: energy transducer TonB [Verrucomicrobiota bacterium]